MNDLDDNYVCKSCKDENIYLVNRSEIKKIAIEKNTSIFLSLIELLNNVRMKNSKKILPLFLDKILPEELSGRELQLTSAIMRLVQISFFQLEDNFDRMELNSCINEMFQQFFKIEANILTMINMIADSRDDNAVDLNMKPMTTFDKINYVKRAMNFNSNDETKNYVSQQVSRFISLSQIYLGNDPQIPEALVSTYL